MCASTAFRPNSATATGLTAPKTTATASTPRFILHDPYSRALSCGQPWGLSGNLPRRSLMTESMIDRPRVDGPRTPLEDTIIYELHVRGYTIHPSSGVRYPGTYSRARREGARARRAGNHGRRAAAVDEFDESDCHFVNPMTGERLRNYWGYNPDRLLRTEGGLRQQPRAVCPLARVLRDGRLVSRGRNRGDSRRRLQSHGRRGRRRADLSFRGIDNTLYLHARRARPLPEFQRLRQHLQQRPSRSCETTSSNACETGSSRAESTVFDSTSPRCSAATAAVTCWSSPRSSAGSPKTRCCATPS